MICSDNPFVSSMLIDRAGNVGIRSYVCRFGLLQMTPCTNSILDNLITNSMHRWVANYWKRIRTIMRSAFTSVLITEKLRNGTAILYDKISIFKWLFVNKILSWEFVLNRSSFYIFICKYLYLLTHWTLFTFVCHPDLIFVRTLPEFLCNGDMIQQ